MSGSKLLMAVDNYIKDSHDNNASIWDNESLERSPLRHPSVESSVLRFGFIFKLIVDSWVVKVWYTLNSKNFFLTTSALGRNSVCGGLYTYTCYRRKENPDSEQQFMSQTLCCQM